MKRIPQPSLILPSLPRRRFIQGLAAGGVLLGLSPWLKPAWAQGPAGTAPVLTGIEFDLTIAETPVNFTGAPRMASTINGSIPAPTPRWREGDTVTIRVTNRLAYGQDSHSHSIASQAVSHHDAPEETPEDPECCAVPQHVSVASFKKWGGGTPVHFVPALTPIPFAALAAGTSPPRWVLSSAAPPGLSRLHLITPLWPNAPPAAMGFLREGRVTAS